MRFLCVNSGNICRRCFSSLYGAFFAILAWFSFLYSHSQTNKTIYNRLVTFFLPLFSVVNAFYDNLCHYSTKCAYRANLRVVLYADILQAWHTVGSCRRKARKKDRRALSQEVKHIDIYSHMITGSYSYICRYAAILIYKYSTKSGAQDMPTRLKNKAIHQGMTKDTFQRLQDCR